ncbi:MAG: hypothetical protein FWD57_03845 [Polyangiaceae bacterium]|nr:hypothetical protein [Polyangiaceae bacterium]
MAELEQHSSGNPEETGLLRDGLAWRAWLEALATDAEAALGAAFAYESFDDHGRDAVIDALDVDATQLSVPRVAVFAPFLSVEANPLRRERIRAAMGKDVGPGPYAQARAMMGTTADGDNIVLVETQVYLGFVRTTMCRLTPDRCVHWVRVDPLCAGGDTVLPSCGLPSCGLDGRGLEGAMLEAVPLICAVDAVARALVAQRRQCSELPSSLRPLVDLFNTAGCGLSVANGCREKG